MKIILKKKRLYIPVSSISLDLATKKYMQSYLKWLSIQNADFNEGLTHEEIVNYFFNGLIHPVWLQKNLKSFEAMVKTDKYLKNYQSYEKASRFEYFYRILPVSQASYTEVIPKEKNLEEPQKIQLKLLNLKDTEINRLSKEEADLVICMK